jgi:hypothetical protein
MKNLTAFTDTTCNYPQFASINEGECGSVEITVRNPCHNGVCGEMATATLSREQFHAFYRALRLAVMPPPVKQMRAELLASGWKPKRDRKWITPRGTLVVGSVFACWNSMIGYTFS